MTTRMLTLGLVLLLAACSSTASDPWRVTLRDGRTVEGTLIRMDQGRYLLQTAEALLELVDDDIAPATFAKRSRREAEPERPIHEVRHYKELHADGSATSYWKHHLHNAHDHAITEYRFGLAPWEQLIVDQREFLDDFGNPLRLEYDPPRAQWQAGWDRRVQVSATLPVPVAPGEDWTVTGRETSRSSVTPTDAGMMFRHVGDYTEDRLVWLKVRLPQGAQLTSVTPEPSARFDDGTFTYVMWRQFYKKGERRDLTVVYTLD